MTVILQVPNSCPFCFFKNKNTNVEVEPVLLPAPGLYQGFKKIAAFEGVRAYFRGNGTQMLRIFPSRAIIFGVNDGLKQILPARLGLGPHATSLLAGSAAGTAAISVTFPLDTVMARLAYQTPGCRRYAGIGDAMRKIFAEVWLFSVLILFGGTSSKHMSSEHGINQGCQ